MARLGCLTSILLMVFAGAALMFFIAAPESIKQNPDVIKFKNSLFCGSENEEYTEVLGGYAYGAPVTVNGRQFNSYCIDVEGQEREVTGTTVAVIIGSFAVPLILGIFLSIFSFAAMARRVQRRVIQQVIPLGTGGTISVNRQNYPADISVTSLNGGDITSPQDAAKIVQDMLNGFTSDAAHIFTNVHNLQGRTDLKSRLKQLEDAKNANLISQAEYDRIRQQILDSMDD